MHVGKDHHRPAESGVKAVAQVLKPPVEEGADPEGLLRGEGPLFHAPVDAHLGDGLEAVGEVAAARIDDAGTDDVPEGGKAEVAVELAEVPAQGPQTLKEGLQAVALDALPLGKGDAWGLLHHDEAAQRGVVGAVDLGGGQAALLPGQREKVGLPVQ